MIRRHVLAALAVGVEAGDDEAAREAVRRTDWVLRSSARRQLEHALIDAALLAGTHVSAADADAMRHVQRVAALNIAGRIDVDATDRAAVAASYADLVVPPAWRAPIATIGVGFAIAALVMALAWVAIVVRTPERAARPPAPLVAGAYFHGGVPARDAALERFFVEELTTLVIETDADRRGSRKGAPRARRISELRAAPVIAARGSALATAWRALIDSLDRWAGVRGRGRAMRDAAADLGRRAHDVSQQLAALGLGYYLQADTLVSGGAHAAVFVFLVEDVTFVRAGGEPRRVLGLRRLDELNARHMLLGRQGDELGDPVILLDQIDSYVADRVLPTLWSSAYRLGDDAWALTGAGRRLGGVAGGAIRRELVAALGPIADPAVARSRVTHIVAASVRRHEARHGVDIERERALRYPRPLAAILGNRDHATKRAELELAAYVSQIGNEPAAPQLALWNLASQAFHRERWGGAEATVAAIVIEGLARQFGITAGRPVMLGTRIDRDVLARLAEPLAAQSSEKLRAAARKLWIELYGEPMLPIVDVRR